MSFAMALSRRARSIVSTTAFRVSAMAVGMFLLAAALITAALFWQVNRALTQQVVRALSTEAAVLQSELANGGPDAFVAAVRARTRAPGGGLYYLAGRNGEKLAGNLSRVPPEIGGDDQGAVFNYETGEGAARLAVARDIAGVEPFRLLIGRDVEDQRQLVGQVRFYALAGFGLLALLALAGGLAVSWLVLCRVEAMTASSRAIMSGDLSQRLPETGQGDELDRLAASLNAMLERIEQLLVGMREISDNIAHDLKTPVNRLRVNAEAALRDPSGGPAYRAGLERVIETADDIIKTFNALLLIARLEAGALKEMQERFDIDDMIADVADLYEPLADENGLRLETARPGPLHYYGNRHLIGQAVANLIDNAIKYAAPVDCELALAGADPIGLVERRDPVQLSVNVRDGAVVIGVGDRGPGIAAADRERVMARFVRLDASRTRPGTGLGLSLVQAVARLHGGHVRLTDHNPGLLVELALPLPAG